MTDLVPYEEAYLAHFGVRGMKWGKRKASAQALVSRRGGHKKGAIAAEVGKVATINVISNLGGALVNTLARDYPAVKAGSIAITSLIQAGALANGIANTVAIAKADKTA